MLETLKRENDLRFAQKLHDIIHHSRVIGGLTDDQALELTGRICHWQDERTRHFVSPEYKMCKQQWAFNEDNNRRTKR